MFSFVFSFCGERRVRLVLTPSFPALRAIVLDMSTNVPAPPPACLITVSYRVDLVLARGLCASVDAFLDERVEHVLVVPRSDEQLFAPLLTARRRLVLVEDVLPRDYRKLPLPQRIHVGPFRRRLREMWWTPRGVVRGWIIQQVLKLSAPAARKSVV